MSIHPEANYLEYVLRTQNLTKQFGEKTAVKNVSMQIKKGEIYGFIGKNGAGIMENVYKTEIALNRKDFGIGADSVGAKISLGDSVKLKLLLAGFFEEKKGK